MNKDSLIINDIFCVLLKKVIKRDVIKIKVALKNPICFSKMKEFILNDKLEHGDEDLLINKEFIKEFYEEKDDWNE